MLEFEFKILDFIHNNMSSPFMDKIMKFFTFLGDAGWIWIITAITLLCTKKYRKTGIMLALGLVLGLVCASVILKPLVARLRPFQLRESINLIINAPRDFSFPSGHTTASVVCATIIGLTHKKAALWVWTFASLIAFSSLFNTLP